MNKITPIVNMKAWDRREVVPGEQHWALTQSASNSNNIGEDDDVSFSANIQDAFRLGKYRPLSYTLFGSVAAVHCARN